MRLVPDWHEAWRWFSVQALAAIIALPIVWVALPADAKGWVPDSWHTPILILLAAAGLVGRLVDQNKGKAQ